MCPLYFFREFTVLILNMNDKKERPSFGVEGCVGRTMPDELVRRLLLTPTFLLIMYSVFRKYSGPFTFFTFR